MARFHISTDQITDGVVALSREESRHAILVLRLKAGDVVEVFDGKGRDCSAVVIGAKDGILSLSLNENSTETRRIASLPSVEITLAASVIKPERMELLIQKACELGVHEIVPLLSERTVVRLSRERWEAKIKRWRKITVESCKQCGRTLVPEVRDVCEFKKFLEALEFYDKILIPTLAFSGNGLYASLKKSAAKKILVFVGPEGDFTVQEVRMAMECGAEPVTLGSLVMRSETAAIYLLSTLNFFYNQIQLNQDKI